MGPGEMRGIIDFHCHVASEMCFPLSFRKGVLENMTVALEARGAGASKRRLQSLYEATLQDPWCDELVQEMDEAGIDSAVLLLPDFTFSLRDSTHNIEELIEHHRLVRERHPGRFSVLVGVDPRWGSDGLALFERAITSYGFNGLKLYPPCGYRPSDRALWPYYEICEAQGLPVLTHIGATSPALAFEPAQPMYLDEPAKAFPGVNFVLAHGSVRYTQECAMLCSHRPNVYMDISGYEVDVGELQRLFRRGINHKILFGTDWPVFRLQGRQREFVNALAQEAVFPKSMQAGEIEMFFRGTATRLLQCAGRSALQPEV